MSQICDRCGSPTDVFTMSYFNTDTLCMECDELEKRHPDYQKAKAAESAEVEKGNFNFDGIGLPAGYREWARAKKQELATKSNGEDDDDESMASTEDILALIDGVREKLGIKE